MGLFSGIANVVGGLFGGGGGGSIVSSVASAAVPMVTTYLSNRNKQKQADRSQQQARDNYAQTERMKRDLYENIQKGVQNVVQNYKPEVYKTALKPNNQNSFTSANSKVQSLLQQNDVDEAKLGKLYQKVGSVAREKISDYNQALNDVRGDQSINNLHVASKNSDDEQRRNMLTAVGGLVQRAVTNTYSSERDS